MANYCQVYGLWRDSLHVTCGLTACTPGSAPGPTLGNEYRKTLPYYSSRAYGLHVARSVCQSCGTRVFCETAEPLESLWRPDCRWSKESCTYSMGVHIGATWRIRLNDPCTTAMLLYVKSLWPLV